MRTRLLRGHLLAAVVGGLLLTGCGAQEVAGSGEPDDSAVDEGTEQPPTEAVDAPDPEPDHDPEPAPDPEPQDTRPRSPLTGERVDEEVLAEPLLLVKVPNTPPARPQAGLDAADIVFEEKVEGGATRFMAVFHSQLAEVVGPIRSARPVDTELLGGYGPSVFAYSGARQEVQRMLAGTPSVRLTEGHPGFRRDRSRDVPWEYTLYIDPAQVREAGVERGAEPLDGVGWTFGPEVPVAPLACPQDAVQCTDPGASISIAMSGAYVTDWEYDAESGVYRRSQNGTPSRVTGAGRIGAANVVVLDARHYQGPTGYPETGVITQGADALVLRDGARYAARWSKPTPDARLRLLTPSGDPFPLAPGATWVHLPDTLPGVTG